MMAEPLFSVEGDPAVTEFARLARGLQGDAGRRDDASFAKVGAKVQRIQTHRRITAMAAAAVAVLSIGVGSFYATRTEEITYQVVNGAVVDGGHVVAGAGTQIRFSDGSEVQLDPGADTHIRALDEHGGRVNLDEGKARVAIAKRPGAAWTVAAGPYTVQVTGTSFSVEWSKKEQSFEIAMLSGSVIVSGPLVGSGMALHAGQRVRTGLSNGDFKLDAAGTPDKVPSAAPAVADPAPPSTADVPSTPGGSSVPGGAHDWSRHAAQGEFAAVIEAAERRGLENTLATASLSDLAALADSARYARRSSLAKRVLMAERKRFPTSGAARDAAFFLGRLAEDEGSGALEWYDRYLAASPRGTYASQALGRKMMLVYQQRGAASARAIADDYLARFPDGPYAAAARKIQDEPATSAP
jgi:hypothetical protein